MDRPSLESVGSLLFAITAVSACSSGAPQPAPTAESLGAAIRESGLRCGAILSTEPIPERESTWRVACSDALVYAATLAEDGEVCIETILAGGFSEELILPPEPRCTPPRGAR